MWACARQRLKEPLRASNSLPQLGSRNFSWPLVPGNYRSGNQLVCFPAGRFCFALLLVCLASEATRAAYLDRTCSAFHSRLLLCSLPSCIFRAKGKGDSPDAAGARGSAGGRKVVGLVFQETAEPQFDPSGGSFPPSAVTEILGQPRYCHLQFSLLR